MGGNHANASGRGDKQMLYKSKLASFLLFASVMTVTSAAAQDAGVKAINDAISAAERVCLSGSRVHFEAKADGSMSITKFSPGGNVTLTVDQTIARGAQFIDSPQVKMLIDQDIRNCMQTQWPIVLKAYNYANIPASEKARLGAAQRAREYRKQNDGCELGTHRECVPGYPQFPCLCQLD